MNRALALAILFLLAASPARADGDAEKGQALAETHCARCHVIGDFNKFGGLGSTPSFGLIAGLGDGFERFRTFYERRPHPAFVTVPGVERWTNLEPYAQPFSVTPENIEDLMAFVRRLEVKDLRRVPVERGTGRR